MNYLFFVIGPTNAGKTTFLNEVKSRYPAQTYLIQVGKILRAKYPPDYFKGQAAPEKTEEEALDIFFSEYKKGQNYKYIFVDGQPRNENQAKLFSDYNFQGRQCHVFHLWAPRINRIERAAKRDRGPALDLALLRMDDDVKKLDKVLSIFNIYKKTLINTEEKNPIEVFEETVNYYENNVCNS